jgi:hypothetical protein
MTFGMATLQHMKTALSKSLALTTKSLFVSLNSDLLNSRSKAFGLCAQNCLMMIASLRKLKSRTRPALPALVIAGLLLTSACATHKKVPVPQLLTPIVDADRARLIAEINRLAAIRSIHGKVDLQFQDTSFASVGIADKYHAADANVIVQRPGKVYLTIQVPLVGTVVAQMTSDGEHFRAAILQGDEKYRRFVKGTNSANYGELKTGGSSQKQNKGQMTEGQAMSAMSNLRPQHLTDALLIKPITQPAGPGVFYSQSEFYEEEPDPRPQQKKSVRIVRSYYLLEEFVTQSSGEAQVTRRFWFDRVGSIRLARLQTFDQQGILVADVTYGTDKTLGEGHTALLPSHIEMTRPHDQYKLSLNYQAPEAVEIDRVYEPPVFVLENKWGLPEVDLDSRQDPRATTSP